MINKKNVLGKNPEDLNVKDAIHVAIVSVRAGKCIQPGERCDLNEFNEAEPSDKGPGVADPFLNDVITTGQNFFLLLDQDEIPNVQHVWEHPKVTFALPTREINRNKILEDIAKDLGVTYEQLMEAAAKVAETRDCVPYPGGDMPEEIAEKIESEEIELYNLWSEWADETGYEFENQGSACCPEYDYPDCGLFETP